MQLLLRDEKYFLATCESTKHPEITSVALQGLYNTCADHSEYQVNRGNLLGLLQGLQALSPGSVGVKSTDLRRGLSHFPLYICLDQSNDRKGQRLFGS